MQALLDEAAEEPNEALEAMAQAVQRDRLALARQLLDGRHILELGAHWGAGASVGFGRLSGQSVGLVAPAQRASRDASHKVSCSRTGARSSILVPVVLSSAPNGVLPQILRTQGLQLPS